MDYFTSILGSMHDALNRLINDKIINNYSKVAIVGVNEYSFAIRTLLEHNDMKVDCYIEEDETAREIYVNKVRSVCARFFNKTDEYIHVYSLDEWLECADENSIVLYVSKMCEYEIDTIVKGCDKNKRQVHCLYDWNYDKYRQIINGRKKITLDEIKKIEKDILFYFDRFCQKNNLRYWVSGGTMLGVLRHKGFIPWDDDIDVLMPDVDYERFLILFKESDLYRCHIVDDYDDVWGHYKFVRLMDKRTLLIENYPFYMHCLGVNIEILPIVGLPRNIEERISYMKKYEKFNSMRKKWFFDCDGNMDAFRKQCSLYQEPLYPDRFDDSEYVGVLGTGYYEKDCTTRSVYEKTLRMPFEDIMVNIPQGYQEYLDTLYGKGWEELPPESKRTAKHNIEAYVI